MLAELGFDSALRMRNERMYVGCGGATEVHHDVGVDMGNLRAADAKSLEAALVDEPAGADAFDLPEDASGAGVILEPRMASAAPRQVSAWLSQASAQAE